MKEIGILLKTKREELNLSIEDISNKTKIQPTYIKAIEEGDIEYFKGDLSFLKYYVRFYCKTVGVDYESLRSNLEENIDDFNNTMTIQRIEDKTEKQNQINNMIKNNQNDFSYLTKKRDYGTITIAIASLCVLGVVFFSIYYLMTHLNQEQDVNPPITDQPSIDEPNVDNENNKPNDENENIVEVEEPISISMQSDDTYVVSGAIAKESTVVIKFGTKTWTRLYLDDVVVENPASKIYQANEECTFNLTPKANTKVTIHLGIYQGNSILVNDQEVPLSDNIKNLTSGRKIHLLFEGE